MLSRMYRSAAARVGVAIELPHWRVELGRHTTLGERDASRAVAESGLLLLLLLLRQHQLLVRKLPTSVTIICDVVNDDCIRRSKRSKIAGAGAGAGATLQHCTAAAVPVSGQ